MAPLAPSPLHLQPGSAWIKVLLGAVLFVLGAGVVLAVYLVTPSGAAWRRKRREQRRIRHALRGTRHG